MEQLSLVVSGFSLKMRVLYEAITWKLIKWMWIGWPRGMVLSKNQSYTVPIVGFSLLPLWKSVRPWIVNVVSPILIKDLIRFTAIWESSSWLRSVKGTPKFSCWMSFFVELFCDFGGSLIFIFRYVNVVYSVWGLLELMWASACPAAKFW